jgi:uncharacterized membrane protein YeaQ/YmgE (transglycosylase-associated protein family)
MSILTWIVLGLIVGFIANKLVNKTGEGVHMNIVLGVIGAVLGGELINKFGIAGAAWLNMWSVLVSVSGAALFLVVYHALQGAPSRPINGRRQEASILDRESTREPRRRFQMRMACCNRARSQIELSRHKGTLGNHLTIIFDTLFPCPFVISRWFRGEMHGMTNWFFIERIARPLQA